jgi:hypothetical protein
VCFICSVCPYTLAHPRAPLSTAYTLPISHSRAPSRILAHPRIPCAHIPCVPSYLHEFIPLTGVCEARKSTQEYARVRKSTQEYARVCKGLQGSARVCDPIWDRKNDYIHALAQVERGEYEAEKGRRDKGSVADL